MPPSVSSKPGILVGCESQTGQFGLAQQTCLQHNLIHSNHIFQRSDPLLKALTYTVEVGHQFEVFILHTLMGAQKKITVGAHLQGPSSRRVIHKRFYQILSLA